MLCLAALVVGLALPGCSSPEDAAGGGPATRPASPPAAGPAPRAASGTVGAAEQRQARQAVRRMTLGQRAGQVIVAAYGGTQVPAGLVAAEHLAGVITFSENIASVAGLRRDLNRLQASDDRPWPVFAGVDQEGGLVTRVGTPLTQFPTFMTHGASGRTHLAAEAARASGEELRAAGFTVVFAPVADVTSGPGDPTIGSRSAGSDPQQVARVVTAAVRGYESAGILSVVKHFPGHGSVPQDSHLGLPVQRAPLHELRRRDLVPFRAAARAGAPAVMVAHLDVRAVDPDVPSSVSGPVVTGLLRERLGFDGLVVTDSMQMHGLTDRVGSGEAAVRSLRAGADLLLMPADPVAAKQAIVAAVRDGRLPGRRLRDAAARVVAALIDVGATEPPAAGVIGSHGGLSQRVSAAAVTVVAGPCSGRLVGDAVRAEGDATLVAEFEQAAEAAGLGTTGGDRVALIGYGGGAAAADVVVATDTPYPLGSSDARVEVATYGATPGAMRALVDVLLGRARAPGSLPVPVAGVRRPGC
jgi:beta-N-acetylhexosaminidase